MSVIKSIFIVSIFIMISNTTYASWYEETEIYETENVDSKWWLSRKKKEELKKEQQIEIDRRIEENKNKEFRDKNIKWLYSDLDITNFPKNKWKIIDDDNDGIGYNYYFDKDGYLLVDTITPDYKIVDSKGREVDYNLEPIKYEINKNIVDEESDASTNNIDVLYNLPQREQSNVIIGEGVVLKNKEKIFDNTIDKNVINYVDTSYRFIKETKGTIYNEMRWKKCSSLKGNGGYVVFNNPNNNFNKITGYIATEYYIYQEEGTSILKVYDADLYDKYNNEHHLDDLDEIYRNDSFNNIDAVKFSFTFDRSIKRLRFELESEENNKSKTIFFKDLKYGFSKTAFYEELIKKKENEEEIEELKRLGIYVEDLWSFDALDEDGEIIYEDEEEHENENNDDRIGGISYDSKDYEDETKSYEDVIRDRNTGPAFDEDLKNVKEIGPGFINIE